MKTVLIILGTLFFLILGTFYTIGVLGPETHIYLGQEVPGRFIEKVNELDLLEPEEKIKYFYSDALMDIKEGLYFVSDQKLVVYSTLMEDSVSIIPFEEMINLRVYFDESFFEDSYIYVETSDGYEIGFPLSSEKGRDKLFYSYLQEKTGIEGSELGEEFFNSETLNE